MNEYLAGVKLGREAWNSIEEVFLFIFVALTAPVVSVVATDGWMNFMCDKMTDVLTLYFSTLSVHNLHFIVPHSWTARSAATQSLH